MPRRKRSQRNSHRDALKLDLHSMKHEDVRRCCIEFIESNWGADEEAHFITGYSKKMKEIVIDLLEEYQLNFQIGDGVNNGYIISWL